ncbi:MAG: hypothetical protein RR313_03655 [Anaerovoracaceae bacterium]
MRHIMNDATLMRYIERDIRLALDDTGKEILEMIQNSMDKWIYEYHKPNQIYAYYEGNPTYEFWNSWRSFVRKSGISGIYTKIESDGKSMSYDPEYGIHGNSQQDLRNEMSGIINNGVGEMDRWYNKPRPFFDDVINKLDTGGYIWAMIRQKMRQRGLNVI